MVRHLLLVETEDTLQELLMEVFTRAGYEVLAPHYTAPVVAELAPPFPKAILLDHNKDYDGIAVCRQIKAPGHLTWAVPVVVMSIDRDAEEAALQAGANAFIAKPFEVDELVKIVRRLAR